MTDTAAGTGPTTRFAYSAGKTVVTDPRGHDVTYSYDGLDRVTRVVDQRGNSQDTSWTSASNVASRTDGLGGVTSSTYDARDRVTDAVKPRSAGMAEGAHSSWSYTGTGASTFFPTTYTDPSQAFRLLFGYDGAGNLSSVANLRMDPAGGESSLGSRVVLDYNPNGTVKSAKDPLYVDAAPNAHITRFSYDAKGNLVGVDNPAPLGDEAFGYDAVSRVTSVTDGKQQTTRYSYDALDRVTQITYADGHTITFSYDPGGNLLSRPTAPAPRPGAMTR